MRGPLRGSRWIPTFAGMTWTGSSPPRPRRGRGGIKRGIGPRLRKDDRVRHAFITLSLLLLLGTGCTRSVSTLDQSVISLHGHPLHLEIARTAEEQRLGLGGRTALSPDHGMLFPFSTTGTYPFWMQGMKIPIDLVWIQDQRIVGIEKQLPPPRAGEEPVTVSPPVPVNRVLELASGEADIYGLAVGMRLTEIP